MVSVAARRKQPASLLAKMFYFWFHITRLAEVDRTQNTDVETLYIGPSQRIIYVP